jgi:hypothetical protein
VQITPDPDLLNGGKIPPLVPNVIDVRITHYEVSATIESYGHIFEPVQHKSHNMNDLPTDFSRKFSSFRPFFALILP